MFFSWVLSGITLHWAENIWIFVRIFDCPLYFIKFTCENIENIADFFTLNVSKHIFKGLNLVWLVFKLDGLYFLILTLAMGDSLLGAQHKCIEDRDQGLFLSLNFVKDVCLSVIVCCVWEVINQRLCYKLLALYLHLQLGDYTKDVVEVPSEIFLCLPQLSPIVSQFNYLSHQLFLRYILLRYHLAYYLWQALRLQVWHHWWCLVHVRFD